MGQSVLRFLPPAGGFVRKCLPYVLFATTIIHRSWIGDPNPLFLFPFFIIAFLICYQGPWYARLVPGIIFYCLVEPLCMLVDSLRDFQLHSVSHEAVTLAIKFLLWAVLWLIIRRIAPTEVHIRLPWRLWAMLGGLTMAPLSSILVFSLWSEGPYSYDAYHAILRRIAYTILPFTTLSALALVVAIVVLARHERLEEARRLANVQAVYYESLQREQREVRTLKHDMMNHVAAVQHLLEQGNTTEAGQYLAGLSQSPALTGTVRLCENDVANAVLSGKATIMRQEGITADWEVSLPAALPLPDIELCALLGNALDNAIEAVRGTGEKRITLRARADKGVLMIRVENPLSKPVQREGKAFRTTKADEAAHGFGLAGMREIARRHGGSLEATAENGRFELLIYLPIA